MTPKLYKATDVCELAQLQPYVLRSWEKEFPGIGIQKAGEAQRVYRQADLDQVLRIKQLVFVEGLTLSGARRRLEDESPAAAPVPSPIKVPSTSAAPLMARAAVEPKAVAALDRDARARIAHVREGLASLLAVLSAAPGVDRARAVDTYELRPPSLNAPRVVRSISSSPRQAAAAPARVRKGKSAEA